MLGRTAVFLVLVSLFPVVILGDRTCLFDLCSPVIVIWHVFSYILRWGPCGTFPERPFYMCIAFLEGSQSDVSGIPFNILTVCLSLFMMFPNPHSHIFWHFLGSLLSVDVEGHEQKDSCFPSRERPLRDGYPDFWTSGFADIQISVLCVRMPGWHDI